MAADVRKPWFTSECLSVKNRDHQKATGCASVETYPAVFVQVSESSVFHKLSRPVFIFCCRRQDRYVGIYTWQGLHYTVVRFSTLFLHFGAKAPFYAWNPILVFALKPLVLKDSLVLKISQLLLKSISPHDLNRVGQEPWNRWYACLFGAWITPAYTFSTPYFCNPTDS